MKGYATRSIFSREAVRLRARVERIVGAFPERADGDVLRCHEVARAVGRVLGLVVQDGKYGMAEHSWLWLPESLDLLRRARERDSKLGNTKKWSGPHLGEVGLLDCYAVGRLPPVQLVDLWFGLPESQAYRFDKIGTSRSDIRWDVVELLVKHARRVARGRK